MKGKGPPAQSWLEETSVGSEGPGFTLQLTSHHRSLPLLKLCCLLIKQGLFSHTAK